MLIFIKGKVRLVKKNFRWLLNQNKVTKQNQFYLIFEENPFLNEISKRFH